MTQEHRKQAKRATKTMKTPHVVSTVVAMAGRATRTRVERRAWNDDEARSRRTKRDEGDEDTLRTLKGSRMREREERE